jgi:HK97 family phage major capsid protein
LEAQLLSAVGAALDDAAINGTGTDEPFGLLADPNIAEHEYSTSIAAADILDMEQAVADNHGEADPSAMAWIADTATRNTLRDTPRAAGITSPVWTDGPNGGPLGYRGIASPWAPAATLIFGHAPDLLILQTGSIEVLVNPYSLDTTGFIRMTVNSWFDFIALNPERSFVRAVPAA